MATSDVHHALALVLCPTLAIGKATATNLSRQTIGVKTTDIDRKITFNSMQRHFEVAPSREKVPRWFVRLADLKKRLTTEV